MRKARPAGAIAGAVLAAAVGVGAPRARAGPLTPAQEVARAQRMSAEAYVYGFALMEFLRQEREQTSVTVPNAQGDAPLNRLGNARGLADAQHQLTVQPNNDTLYTSGHLNLRRGALVLHVPRVPGHRYYSFEFIDPYTNVFAYVGTRTTGNGAGSFLITGPSFRGTVPRGLRRIRSPYDRMWLFGRTLVYGQSDLANVHRIQDGYRLVPLRAYLRQGLRWRPPAPRRIVSRHVTLSEPKGIAFFDALGTALAQNPPPRRDAPILRELRSVGIGPGLRPSREHLSAATLRGLRAAVAAGPGHVHDLRLLFGLRSALIHNGWFVPPSDIADYGTNYALRAVVAAYGIAANRPAEAMYIVGATDPSIALLNGANDYVIHFLPGQLPPARYFWSLTMYDEAFFLVANPLGRYELGDRTPGLRRNPDGSLDIYLQRNPPPGHESNWLPAPAGTFEVTLRLYGPLPSALSGRYPWPPIVRIG